jgi:hypothetical protein
MMTTTVSEYESHDTRSTTGTLTMDAVVENKNEVVINVWRSILNRLDKIEVEIGISKRQRKNVDTSLRQLNDHIHSKIPTSLLQDVAEIGRIQRMKFNATQLSTDRFHQREEILSCAKRYQKSLEQLDQIQLLLQQSSLLQQESPSEDRFRFAVEALPRLKKEEDTLELLWQRTNNIAYRIDTLVQRYHKIIVALSEKLTLIDEQQLSMHPR